MKETGINPKYQAGESNLFLSKVFPDVLLITHINGDHLYNTDALPELRGSRHRCGFYKSEKEASRAEDDRYK